MDMKLPKPAQITVEDLIALVTNQVPEDQNLEYKSLLSLKIASEKKEFLQDVSSFANCKGGIIIYGIGETKGVPTSADGFPIDNLDQTLRQIDSLILDSISPRMPVEIRIWKLDTGNYLLMIAVKESADKPHQVQIDKSKVCYSRTSNRKYQLDIQEIEAMLRQKNELRTMVNKLSEQHLERMLNDATFKELPVAVLQMIPGSVSNPDVRYPILDAQYGAFDLAPLGGGSRTPKANFEGVRIAVNMPGFSFAPNYLQVYKNGIMETLNHTILYRQDMLNARLLEGYVMRELMNYLKFLKGLEVQLPVYIRLVLSGVRGYHLYSEKVLYGLNEQNNLDRDVLEFPVLRISDFDQNVPELLQPLFDEVWNAFNFTKCYHFSDQGKWIYDINFI